jgi:hypothetical protein
MDESSINWLNDICEDKEETDWAPLNFSATGHMRSRPSEEKVRIGRISWTR